jgi:coenzyme PQQ precursor peptide PqqA
MRAALTKSRRSADWSSTIVPAPVGGPRRGHLIDEGSHPFGGNIMKIWNKPQVREQAVGMEVTAYLPADIDLI